MFWRALHHYCQNFLLSDVVTFVQKNVLSGQYSNDQVIKESIDFGSLHELKWMCEYFVSVAFRFNGNAYTKSEERSNN
jgi:hypothetical protein